MGQKAQEPLEITVDELPTYLRMRHSVYMDLDGKTYYLTDVNDHYWRVQDTAVLNEKGHFTDVTEPIDTVSSFLASPAVDGKTIIDVFDDATFYASEKPDD